MSPAILRALLRQRRTNANERARGYGHLYLPPLAEFQRSARWYRALLVAPATPRWFGS